MITYLKEEVGTLEKLHTKVLVGKILYEILLCCCFSMWSRHKSINGSLVKL